MTMRSWIRNLFASRPTRTTRRALARRHLCVESLEDRMVPASFFAGNANALITAINQANILGGANTITLTAPTTSPYALTAVNNTLHGATGLPVIASGDNLTIVGDGDTIERSTVAGTQVFRLLDVADGGTLTLRNLTLQNGLAFGTGVAAQGVAIYSAGTLTLDGVTVSGNIAKGSNGGAGVPTHVERVVVGQPAEAGAFGRIAFEGGCRSGLRLHFVPHYSSIRRER